MAEDTDKRTEALLDEASITAARKAGERIAIEKGLTEDRIKYLRKRCKMDLFFLANGPLEYSLLSQDLHGHVALWLEKTRGRRYRMMLLPRNHYKSTLNTIADGIQMALPNDDNAVQEWPYCLGPNIKILLAHEVREKAADFLYEVTAAFTRKPLMLFLFPECIPSKSEQKVNKWELELPRDEFSRESTFETIGAGSASQGGHYNWLKLDDLIGKEARDSITVMDKTCRWFDEVTNSNLTRPELDGWDLVGTRWSFNDVYSHAMARYGIKPELSEPRCLTERDLEKFKDGLMHVYARGILEDGERIFPEEITWERISVLRKNIIDWAAQQANNPQEGGLLEFPWPLKFYNVAPNGDIIVFSGEDRTRIKVRNLDICVLCDPSMGESKDADESGIIVTGTDSKFNIYILETIKKRLRPPDFVDYLYKLNNKFAPRVITIEEVNFSAIYRYWIEDKSSHTQTFLPIRAYKPGTQRSKDARIRGLAHLFSAGQIYVHEGMHSLRDEYEQFPMGDSKHLLDALAQGPQVWTKGLDQKEIEQQAQLVDDLMTERSALTGY